MERRTVLRSAGAVQTKVEDYRQCRIRKMVDCSGGG